MKANRLRWFLVFSLVSAAFQLPAQQSEADRKLLADICAKAEKGDAQSQYELGKAFATGSLGVTKDHAEGVNWCRKAAEQNDAFAQTSLGFCYINGQGVAKDEVETVNLVYSLVAADSVPVQQVGRIRLGPVFAIL